MIAGRIVEGSDMRYATILLFTLCIGADVRAQSSYDRHVRYDGKNFFFVGPQAVKLWGKPIPLARTNNNYHHVCETPTGRDALLKVDLMNGIVMQYGQRYYITLLDLAILHDCGIPMKPIKDTRTAKDDNPVRPAERASAASAGRAGATRNR